MSIQMKLNHIFGSFYLKVRSVHNGQIWISTTGFKASVKVNRPSSKFMNACCILVKREKEEQERKREERERERGLFIKDVVLYSTLQKIVSMHIKKPSAELNFPGTFQIKILKDPFCSRPCQCDRIRIIRWLRLRSHCLIPFLFLSSIHTWHINYV